VSMGDASVRNRQSLKVATLLLVLEYEVYLRHGYNRVADRLDP